MYAFVYTNIYILKCARWLILSVLRKKIIETETIYIAYFFVHSRAVASYLALSVL